jgi:hypothetical protein
MSMITTARDIYSMPIAWAKIFLRSSQCRST